MKRLRDRNAWPRIFLCLVGALAVWATTEPWHPPLPFRTGWIPDRDILSTVTFDAVDPLRTRAARNQAARDVPYFFANDPTPIDQLIRSLVDVLQQLRQAPDPPPVWSEFLPLDRERRTALGEQETRLRFERFRDRLATAEDLDRIVELIEHGLRPYLTHGILDPKQLQQRPFSSEEGSRRDEITVYPAGQNPENERLWVRSVPVSDTLLGDGSKLNQRLSDKAESIEVADHISWYLLRHLDQIGGTLTFDGALTQQRINLARASVDAVQIRYLVDSVLAEAGKPLGEEQLELLRQEHATILAQTPWEAKALRAAASLCIVSAMFALCGFYGAFQEPRLYRSISVLITVLTLAVVVVWAAQWLAVDQWRAEVIPVLVFALSMAIAFRQEVALLLSLVLCVLVTFAIGASLGYCIAMMATVAIGVFMGGRIRSRTKLLWVGVACGTAMLVLTIVTGILAGQPLQYLLGEGVRYGLWCVAAGFLMNGLLPFLEYGFGVVTDLSLLELGDVSHPLLQELVQRAPGTYNHSINVAAIGEAAAEAIGANGLLVRVSAYFHDIGKMLKPEYFVENQNDQVNRHETLMPAMSTLIIIAHVKDGADLARQHNLPQPLIDFIEQHHGTTLVQYFYNRANQQEAERPDGKPIEESAFRYPGPKPQTKEAGVMMLADAVESASRTLAEPTATRIRNLVQELANARLMDGQFDESGLTLQEIRVVQESLVKSLIAVYHGRVKYPDAKRPEREVRRSEESSMDRPVVAAVKAPSE